MTHELGLVPKVLHYQRIQGFQYGVYQHALGAEHLGAICEQLKVESKVRIFNVDLRQGH